MNCRAALRLLFVAGCWAGTSALAQTVESVDPPAWEIIPVRPTNPFAVDCRPGVAAAWDRVYDYDMKVAACTIGDAPCKGMSSDAMDAKRQMFVELRSEWGQRYRALKDQCEQKEAQAEAARKKQEEEERERRERLEQQRQERQEAMERQRQAQEEQQRQEEARRADFEREQSERQAAQERRQEQFAAEQERARQQADAKAAQILENTNAQINAINQFGVSAQASLHRLLADQEATDRQHAQEEQSRRAEVAQQQQRLQQLDQQEARRHSGETEHTNQQWDERVDALKQALTAESAGQPDAGGGDAASHDSGSVDAPFADAVAKLKQTLNPLDDQIARAHDAAGKVHDVVEALTDPKTSIEHSAVALAEDAGDSTASAIARHALPTGPSADDPDYAAGADLIQQGRGGIGNELAAAVATRTGEGVDAAHQGALGTMNQTASAISESLQEEPSPASSSGGSGAVSGGSAAPAQSSPASQVAAGTPLRAAADGYVWYRDPATHALTQVRAETVASTDGDSVVGGVLTCSSSGIGIVIPECEAQRGR